MTIDRRGFSSLLASGAAATLVAPLGGATAIARRSRNLVLVHGLFADGS